MPALEPQALSPVQVLLLATGLRREELVNLNLDQVVLGTRSDALAKKPVTAEASALFLRAASVRLSKSASGEERGGRLAVRSMNGIFAQIGQWFNAELREDDF